MNATDPQRQLSTTDADAAKDPSDTTTPRRDTIRRPSPVRQTLLIVGILLGGLLAGTFILRSEKKTPASEEHGEKAESKPGEKHDAHHHGEKDEHGAKGRVELTAEKLQNAHLGIEPAGPAQVRLGLTVFGKIVPDEEKLAHVSPRFAGIARKINKRLGDRVSAGEVLATVESNESLQGYDIKAPLTGTIIERNVTVGEFVGTDKNLFTVADLSTVWVDFQVYQQDFAKLHVGQPVQITTTNIRPQATPSATPPPLAQEKTGMAVARVDASEPEGSVGSTVAYLSPFGTENTQTMLARAYVSNEAGALRPGLFVTGEVAVDEVRAPVAVREAAVQTLDGKEVVFVEEEGAFEARTVEVGRRDHEWAEILSGVKPGERYVAVNSFLLKAEIGKEGAEHED